MDQNEPDLIKKSYLDILRYASTESFVSYDSVFSYLHKNNITFFPGEKVTENNAMLQTFFKTFFRDGEGNRPINIRVGAYYLSPEALFYILNSESLEHAKQSALEATKESAHALEQSKRANFVAILSLAITSFLAAVQIYLQLK